MATLEAGEYALACSAQRNSPAPNAEVSIQAVTFCENISSLFDTGTNDRALQLGQRKGFFQTNGGSAHETGSVCSVEVPDLIFLLTRSRSGW